MSREAIAIHTQVQRQAQERPSETAISFGEEQLTHAELNERANRLAHYLIGQGVGPNVPVGMCLKPSPEVAVSLLGILKSGGVYVPMDPSDPRERLATFLEDTRPRIVFSTCECAQNLPSDNGIEVVHLARGGDQFQNLPATNPSREIDLDTSAYLFYTSGTTGKPKGVVASHRNLCHYILSAQEEYGLTPSDTLPALARFTFSISLFNLLAPLVAGGRAILLERDQILNFKYMAAILGEVTMVHASPSWWRKMLDYLVATGLAGGKFPRLRHVSAGGDMVAPDLVEMMKRVFPKAEVFVIYGCTEISCMGCTYLAPRGETVAKTWVGWPFRGVTAQIFDEKQTPVPDCSVGEIYFAGEGVTTGYQNRPELTKEKFLRIDGECFYRTGDLGRHVNGNLEILGRVDFQIQLRGIRIEPGEIEAHLRSAPGVRDGVVVARELGASEKSLVAYIVPAADLHPNVEALRAFLQSKLPDYMIPAAFVILDAIPLTPNGKIDRRSLPVPTSENIARATTPVPPRDRLEEELLEAWQEVLGRKNIGVEDSFFDLGGDSLQALQILSGVEERWQKIFPITLLLRAKTIALLAEAIRSTPAENIPRNALFETIVSLREGDQRPPLLCLQGALLYHPLAESMEVGQPVYAIYLPEEIELLKKRTYDPVHSVFATIPRLAGRYLELIGSVQPRGPYHLAGSSFAGLIAFEIARELREAGEEVALVALFDSMMIRRISLRRRWECHWNLFREQGFSYLSAKLRHRADVTRQKLTGSFEGQIHTGAESASEISIEVQQDILDEVSIRAARSYVPRPYDGKLVLFRATDQSFFNQDSPDLGWTSYAAGDFRICHIPGSHLGILKDPAVSVLARNLQAEISSRPPKPDTSRLACGV